MDDLGKKLKEYRLSLSGSPSVPKFAKIVGLKKDNIYKWEKGTMPSSADDLLKLKKLLGIVENVPHNKETGKVNDSRNYSNPMDYFKSVAANNDKLAQANLNYSEAQLNFSASQIDIAASNKNLSEYVKKIKHEAIDDDARQTLAGVLAKVDTLQEFLIENLAGLKRKKVGDLKAAFDIRLFEMAKGVKK